MSPAASDTCAGCSTPGEGSAAPVHGGQICTLPAAPRGGCRPPRRRAPRTPPVTERPWTPSQVRGVCVSSAHSSSRRLIVLLFLRRRAAVSAVGRAACGRRPDQLVGAFGLAAAAAPDAAAAGAAAGAGGATAGGERPPRHTARQQPRQHRLGRAPTQHGGHQQRRCHRRRGRKQPVICFPPLPVPFSTVSAELGEGPLEAELQASPGFCRVSAG